MRLDLHAVVQNPTNANQVGPHCPIKQEVSRLANQAILCPGAIAAVAQMVAAHREPEFWPRGAAGAFWIGSYISQTGDQQRLVASSRSVPEPLLGVGEDLDYVFLGGRRKPKVWQRLLTGSPNSLGGSLAQAFDEALQAIVLDVGVATMIEV